MKGIKNIFAGPWGIIIVGIFIGILAPLLQKLGNPANMGVCVACFVRDIAGALGLHRADVVQYIRPEIIGFVLGSLVAAYLFKEFRPRLGSATIVRFFLGVFAMIGALVFLGCPWRAALRLAGGDGTAILGLLGLIAGVWIGTLFLKGGYNLGRTQETHAAAGWMLPLTASRVRGPSMRRWPYRSSSVWPSDSWPSAAASAPWAPSGILCSSGRCTCFRDFWR